MRTFWLISTVCLIAGCASQPSPGPVWPEASNASSASASTTSSNPPLAYQEYSKGTNASGASNTMQFDNVKLIAPTPATADTPHAEINTANPTSAKPEPQTEASAPAVQDYDRQVINTILKHWQDLRSHYPAAAPGRSSGKVVVSFRLHADGRIGVVKTVSSGVDSVLTYMCEQAVKESAPYPRWPQEMLDKLGAESQMIRYTFDYE